MANIGLKTSRILLPSSARSSTTGGVNSLMQQDSDAAGLRLYLNISAIPAAGGAGLTVVIRGYDKISGNTVELTTGGLNPCNQVGTYAYEMSFAPDPPFANVRDASSRSVPYQWDALVKHLDTQSYTYSLSAEITK